MQQIELEDARTLLRRTPDVLDALLGGVPDVWVHENEGPATWSSFEVVGQANPAKPPGWGA